MKAWMQVLVIVAAVSGIARAQESKPVPKDSVRVTIPGCTKGYIFTAGPRTMEQPGSVNIPEGTHLRMNGPRKLIADIKAHEGGTIEITGIMKKGQYLDGVSLGGGVRVGPGSTTGVGSPTAGQIYIDVEGWRSLGGSCPTK